MEIAKVFMTGRSQAVRIPKKYRFDSSEVEIRRQGNKLILSPLSTQDALQAFLDMPCFPNFEIDRTNAQAMQDRELFK